MELKNITLCTSGAATISNDRLASEYVVLESATDHGLTFRRIAPKSSLKTDAERRHAPASGPDSLLAAFEKLGVALGSKNPLVADAEARLRRARLEKIERESSIQEFWKWRK